MYPDDIIMMSDEAIIIGTDKNPPFLNSIDDYPRWKDRFLEFIDRQELGEEMLQSLKEGPAELYINDDPSLPARQEVVNRSGYSLKEYIELRAMSYLFRGMNNEILSCVSSQKTAKGLWDRLSTLMQGSESSARIKVAQSYEDFKAKDGEFLEVTYNRYCRLVNELRKNGFNKSNIEINIKFLRNLKPEWKRVATNIMQNQNLSEFDIHVLFRNLNPLALVADKRQENSFSNRGLKVDKELAQSYLPRLLTANGSDQEPPVLFCRGHFSSWKRRFLFFIRGQEIDLKLHNKILRSLLEGPAEFFINADPPLHARREVMDRSSLSEKQKNRIKADKAAISYLRRGLTNEILACIDSYKTAKGMWDELSKQMQETGLGADIKLEEIGKCYNCGKPDCYVLQSKQRWS